MKKTIQLITSLCCFALGGSSYAATGTWIGGTGGGSWESVCIGAQSWTNSDCTIPNGVGEIANITANASGGRVVTLNTDRTVGTLRLDAGGAAGTPVRNCSLRGTGTLTLDNGASKPQITAIGGDTAPNTAGVVLAGVNGLEAPVGGGRIVLGTNNTYTGDTHIVRRFLRVQHVDSLPHGTRAGNAICISGGNPGDSATLEFDGLDAVTINGLSSNTNNFSSARHPTICAYNAPRPPARLPSATMIKVVRIMENLRIAALCL